jgi:lipid A 3-O-deacylase
VHDQTRNAKGDKIENPLGLQGLSRRITLLASLWLLLSSGTANGQAIDLTGSFRTVDSDEYLRLHYEDDLFACTDYYYSEGIGLEFIHPKLKYLCLGSLLWPRAKWDQHGIALEQNGYTPTSIESDTILYGDRPFAATLLLTSFSIGYREGRNIRLSSSLSVGVIGPAAGGYEMQSTIHKWIDDVQPRGWQNQIQNDFVINYEAGIETNLLSQSDILMLNGLGKLRVGTLSIKLSPGIVLMMGRIDHRILSGFSRKAPERRSPFGFHLYWQGMLNLVGYDATLQGGMFNRTSPYTIPPSELWRMTFQTSVGFAMSAIPFYIEYGYTFSTPEFQTGLSHGWGRVGVGIALKTRAQ